MSFIDKYKKLNDKLDELFMEEFGRCDRNNIDIKNLNPPVLLQTVAIIELINKIDILLNKIEKINLISLENENDEKKDSKKNCDKKQQSSKGKQ